MPRQKRKYHQVVMAEDVGEDWNGNQTYVDVGSTEEWAIKKENEERERKKQKGDMLNNNINGINDERAVKGSHHDDRLGLNDTAMNTNGDSLAIRNADHKYDVEIARRDAEIARLELENQRLTRELDETRVALRKLQTEQQRKESQRQSQVEIEGVHLNTDNATSQSFSDRSRPSSIAITSTTTSRAASPSRTASRNPLIHRSSLTSNSVTRPAQLAPPSIQHVRRLTPNGVLPPSFSPAPRIGRESDFAKPDLASKVRESRGSAGKDGFTFLKRL